MSKSTFRGGQVQVVSVNGTLSQVFGENLRGGQTRVILLNNTMLEVRLHEPFRDSQHNELLYVIIVIVFYATALMTLIITQIKRQRREGTEVSVDYYDEYLQRNSEVKRTCQTATNIVARQNNNNSSRNASISGSSNVTAANSNGKKGRGSSAPPPALATAAFAAAAAGTLLGKTPYIPPPPDESPEGAMAALLPDGGEGVRGEHGGVEESREGGLGLGGLTTLVPFGSPRLLHSRDRSPVLESIPDEEV